MSRPMQLHRVEPHLHAMRLRVFGKCSIGRKQAELRVVASAFNHRRKMLRQSLKSLNVDAIELCKKAGIEETLRAEQCTLPMFAQLGRAFAQMVDKPGDI